MKKGICLVCNQECDVGDEGNEVMHDASILDQFYNLW